MYLRIRPLGTVTGVPEVWTISPAFRWVPVTSTFNQAQLQSLADRVVTAITTSSLASLRILMSASAQITGWRVEQYDEDDVLQGSAESSYGTALVGTTTAVKSLQDAVVCSLRTNTPGARGRGRIYWPGFGAVTSAWRISTPSPATLATDFKAVLLLLQGAINAEALANGMGNVAELAVRSITTKQSLKVVRLEVGDVLDTQRRRRDRVPEIRSSVSY